MVFDDDPLMGHAPIGEGTTPVEYGQPVPEAPAAAVASPQVEAEAKQAPVEVPAEKVALLPFFFRVPSQFLRPQQQVPQGAPIGLQGLRQLNAGSQGAVANFSRDVAPGTAVENLTLGLVEAATALAGALAAVARLQSASIVVKAPVPIAPAAPRVQAPASATVEDALSALPAGRSSGVKVVESADELEALFGRLSAGGKSVEGTTYPGQLVELPDGTTVGLRAGSKSGGPTIDIVLPNGTPRKVHVQ